MNCLGVLDTQFSKLKYDIIRPDNKNSSICAVNSGGGCMTHYHVQKKKKQKLEAWMLHFYMLMLLSGWMHDFW